jgi:AcrR family transcriptional regulator
MARRRPDDRLDRLVDAAAAVFTARGYRRTQMADVARAMGVAPGTLYLYVESKEALFDLVVQRAFLDRPLPPPARLPVPTPEGNGTLAHVRARFATEARLAALDGALARRRVRDARAELAGIVTELYDFIARKRRAIALIERCALDWPQLAALFYTDLRRGLLQRLTRYLERRRQRGQLRPFPHPAGAARLIIETISWFTRHRLNDPDATQIDDAIAKATVIDALVNAFAKE